MSESDWDDDEYSDMPDYVELDDDFYQYLKVFMYSVLKDHGNVVYEWPDDEAEAYRDAGGFREGTDAVRWIRAKKAVEGFKNMMENI